MLQVGDILHDRYRLERQLAKSSARQTWLAEDRIARPPELVVVKFLAFGDGSDWESQKLFEREARVLQNLNHPRIPKYRDYFSIEDGLVWFGLVREYVPGSSLKDSIERGQRFSEAEVRQIATEILEISIYLHELSPPVLHRDIKPGNLILSEDRRVYLIDFGSVQERVPSEGATFTIAGTYGYAPIEQFGGRAVPASDLYALGATLIHVLTGVVPADLPQQDSRFQFREYVSVSEDLIRWIETLTEPTIEKRFKTARQALAALQNPAPPVAPLVSKPRNSRIRLEKSATHLDIKLPMRGPGISELYLAMFLIFWYGITISVAAEAFPFIIIFWLAGSILLRRLFYPTFSAVHLKFDRQKFVFKWKLMGITYRQTEGNISAIEDVRASRGELSLVPDRPIYGVAIRTDAREWAFGSFAPKLSLAEQDWLAGEIADWLRLKSRSPDAFLPR